MVAETLMYYQVVMHTHTCIRARSSQGASDPLSLPPSLSLSLAS